MCVVDRRDQSAHAPSANYAHVQKILQNRVEATGSGDVDDVDDVVTPVDVDEESSQLRRKDELGGVPVVEGTPGPEALIQFMLKRVWNIETTRESLSTDLLLV